MAGFTAQTRILSRANPLVTEEPPPDEPAPETALRDRMEAEGGRLELDVQELAEEFGFPRISARRAQEIDDALARVGLRAEPPLGVGVVRVSLCADDGPRAAAPASDEPAAPRVIGYVPGAADGAAELVAVAAECERRGWTLGDLCGTGNGASHMGLEGALERLDAGHHDALVVARLAGLSKDAIDVYRLMDRAHRHGWSLVCLEPPVDTTSETGAAMAAVAGAFVRLERELIAQRREAASNGARGKRGVDPETRELIVRLHHQGRSEHEIAERVDVDGVPSPSGRGWTGKAVGKVLEHHRRVQAQAGAASSSSMRSRSSRAASSVNGPRPE